MFLSDQGVGGRKMSLPIKHEGGINFISCSFKMGYPVLPSYVSASFFRKIPHLKISPVGAKKVFLFCLESDLFTWIWNIPVHRLKVLSSTALCEAIKFGFLILNSENVQTWIQALNFFSASRSSVIQRERIEVLRNHCLPDKLQIFGNHWRFEEREEASHTCPLKALLYIWERNSPSFSDRLFLLL